MLANVLSLFACVEILKLQMACSFFIVLFPEDCYVSVSVCVCIFVHFHFVQLSFSHSFMLSFQPFLFSFSLFSCQFHFQSFFYV